MRLAFACACLALAGCDRLLHVEAVTTAPRPDAGGDAHACTLSLDDTMDEDCDGIADTQDPCPADIEQTDIDGDGVGDVCDPDPAASDRVVMFDGFAAPSGAWQVSSGTWDVAAGMLGNANTDGVIVRAVTTSHPLLEAQIYVNSFGTSPYVTAGMSDASSTIYECRVYPESGGIKIQAAVLPLGGTAMLGPMQEVLGAGRVRVQVVEASPGMLTCRAQYSETSSGSSALAISGAITATNVALAASSTDVLFDSVTVTGL